jgi:cell division protein FtsX
VISNQLRRYEVLPYVTRKNLMKRQKILVLAVSIFFAALFLFGAIAILAAERAPAKIEVPASIDPSVELRGSCTFVSMEIFRIIF